MSVEVNKHITIDDDELHFTFIRASGPGGQNVNKVASAAQLRFDIPKSKSLSDREKTTLLKKYKSKLTNEGVLVITARRFRVQEKNRADAISRLVSFIKKGLEKKAKRIQTKATKSGKEKRLKTKKQRGELKKARSRNIEY